MAIFNACTKDDTTLTEESVTQYVDEAIYSVQERSGTGRLGCFELVFPITLQLPDSTTVTVNSYEEMQTILHQYFTNNGSGGNQGGGHHGNHHGGQHGLDSAQIHVQLVFPISVINQDGEIITVANQQELHDLRATCEGSFDHHNPQGHCQNALSCFGIVFPVTIAFPDGTTAEATSREAMHDLIHQWREANPGVQGHPEMVFPITVQMTADSSLVTVNSRQELRDLKESCE